MNIRNSALTFAIILINIIFYLIMVSNGVNFIKPSAGDILDWGGNFDAFIVKGEWWRLITAMFIHFGVIHLAVNMLTLFFLGRQFETKYGSLPFIFIYFISGIAASITSNYMNMFKVGCGASGAIFGIAGGHFALLLTERDERKFTRGNELTSLFTGIALNIILGMKIKFFDFPAHLGGLFCGFFLGLCCQPLMRYKKEMFRSVVITYLILISVSAGGLYVTVKNLPPYRYWYFSMFQSFIKNDDETLSILRNPDSYINTLVTKANIKAADKIWSINLNMLFMFKDIPADLERDIYVLKKYIRLRKKSLAYFSEYIEKNEFAYLDSVDQTLSKLSRLPPLTYRIGFHSAPEEKDSSESKLVDFREFYDSTWQVTTAEKAAYYRLARKDSLGNVNGFVRDYFLDGHIQMKGKYTNNLRTGIFFYFNKDGSYQSYGEYKTDEPVGIWKYFYKNGQLESIVDYSQFYSYQLGYWDSTGRQLVIGGEGKYELHFINGLIAVTGNYKEGKREGKWKGFYENGKPYYFENYADGKLIFGERMDKNGIRHRYNSEWVSAYPIGLDSNETYTDYLEKNLDYPFKAKAEKIEGIVIVQFDVDTLGNVKNVKPLSRLGFGCDEEAVRVIKEGLKFSPARHRGETIEQSEKIPVTFSLK